MSSLFRDDKKYTINSFKFSSKTHATLSEKKYIRLYAEHIHFLLKRAEWLVTDIYEPCIFEQSKFKKDFVIMNQKAGQQATSSVESSQASK